MAADAVAVPQLAPRPTGLRAALARLPVFSLIVLALLVIAAVFAAGPYAALPDRGRATGPPAAASLAGRR